MLLNRGIIDPEGEWLPLPEEDPHGEGSPLYAGLQRADSLGYSTIGSLDFGPMRKRGKSYGWQGEPSMFQSPLCARQNGISLHCARRIKAVFGKLSPLLFYRKSLAYQFVAFSTSSTKALLPTTMAVCREKLGVSKLSASFILPLGASVNMDGLAIYLGLCTVTFAQAAGVALSPSDYGIIMLTATLGSLGGAGIPSAAIVMLPMILSSVNLPLEGVALIAGIDRIMDIMRSTISITGDAAVTVVVDSAEGQLDREVYYS